MPGLASHQAPGTTACVSHNAQIWRQITAMTPEQAGQDGDADRHQPQTGAKRRIQNLHAIQSYNSITYRGGLLSVFFLLFPTHQVSQESGLHTFLPADVQTGGHHSSNCTWLYQGTTTTKLVPLLYSEQLRFWLAFWLCLCKFVANRNRHSYKQTNPRCTILLIDASLESPEQQLRQGRPALSFRSREFVWMSYDTTGQRC